VRRVVYGLAFLSFTLLSASAQERPFVEGAFQVLEKAACRSCHNPDGVASVTRLQFPEADATPDKIERFGKALVVLVDPAQPAESLLLKKPTNKTAHAGGARIAPAATMKRF
jgi:hypothetical protein